MLGGDDQRGQAALLIGGQSDLHSAHGQDELTGHVGLAIQLSADLQLRDDVDAHLGRRRRGAAVLSGDDLVRREKRVGQEKGVAPDHEGGLHLLTGHLDPVGDDALDDRAVHFVFDAVDRPLEGKTAGDEIPGQTEAQAFHLKGQGRGQTARNLEQEPVRLLSPGVFLKADLFLMKENGQGSALGRLRRGAADGGQRP